MKNRTMRKFLEMAFGKGCMFKKANVEDKIKSLKTIKGYETYVSECHLKGKKIKELETTMTLHHLHHKADGGETTVENSAVVSELAHRYLHSLPREDEEVINDMLRAYKDSLTIKIGELSYTSNGICLTNTHVLDTDTLDETYSIKVYDNTEEVLKKRERFNRAKNKLEDKEIIRKGLEDYEQDR